MKNWGVALGKQLNGGNSKCTGPNGEHSFRLSVCLFVSLYTFLEGFYTSVWVCVCVCTHP